jgi:hypothetical protein
MTAFPDAQRDMRTAYYNGSTGAVASATAWLAAALVATFVDAKTGILTLIFGGMVIFPASVVLSKLLGRSGQHAKDNPLAPLAISGTVWMLLCIPIAIAVSLYRIEWFFPAMLLVIGGRYLTFPTLYGLKLYWIFGAVLALSVAPLIALNASVATGAFTGAIVEYIFGLALFFTKSPNESPPVDRSP